MGMFDWVVFETKCRKCKQKIDGFQSKDSVCCLNTIDFWEVRNFYAPCDNCASWIEYDLKSKNRPNRKISLKDYKMTFRKSTKREEKEHENRYKRFAKIMGKKHA